ncbi:hypothetical protein COEREDRAFT_82961 [Coemansia reversa NRRL 1564]|uniref:Secreted protein n=1 Tax=Coemansia reversa (strain ATCC 12441 / NRRL 1564) TaxID=763665 RepID=A0A2G5B552_COERN|nr:hypothetical protein COEREDRAFT_82961 [Coemansia reversa NRRL 1564]|eukprot:PIA14136.1 hypothetical protein COEREDRAFT_82961 [Coemansia reversa NRRL 1564]
MKFFATLVLAATAVVAQQIGSDSGPTVADGPSAVSNPNINNGQQAQNSLVDGSNKGGNVFQGLTGNTFSDSVSNLGISDNNFVNPSQTSVSGNKGDTANGEGNHIGDFIQAATGFGPIRKRDAVFNNFDHAAWGYHPVFPVYAPVYGVPVYPHPGFVAPVAHVNHNSQNAAIVQNQV